MAISVPSKLLNLHSWLPNYSNPSDSASVTIDFTATSQASKRKKNMSTATGSCSITARCTPLHQQTLKQEEEDDDDDEGVGIILCQPCNGKGWLLCDFCKGQKTNVKSENNRIYRRCPNCKAVGYVLCASCKVFKCVTFPDYDDGEL